MRKVVIVLLFLFSCQSYSPQYFLAEENVRSDTEVFTDNWNRTGVTLSEITLDNGTNPTIDRPSIIWSATTGNGLMEMRTGACMVSVPQNNSFMLMGGRMDPNPAANQDESPSAMVEIFNVNNGSWEPSPKPMNEGQQYAGCARAGDIVALVGDWYPAEGNKYPKGMIQMYNISNGTWYSGTNMSTPYRIGHAGVASHGGHIYVAGGVRNPSGNSPTNRTFRYDIANDTWTRMADMHHARYAFAFIEFHGLIYAIGGAQKTSSSSWVQPTALDYVEAYDPVNDVWLNQSAIPVTSFAWDAAILHDEIILAGGFSSGSMSNKVYGYNPLEGTWTTHGTMVVPAHDVAIASLDGVIAYGSGDMSQYLYNTWSRSYSADSEWQNSIDYHAGYITSEIIDLRPNSESSATPIQMSVNGQTDSVSDLAWQWRGAINPATIYQLDWRGKYGINSWYDLGTWDLNPGVQMDHLQYRLELNATSPDQWSGPGLDNVSILAEHAGFASTIPVVVNPLAESIVIQTTHQAFSNSAAYRLDITSSTSTGSLEVEQVALKLENGVFSYEDPNGLLRAIPSYSASDENGVATVNWSVEFATHPSIDYLRFSTNTEGVTSTTYFHSQIVEVDNDLHVNLESSESNWTSIGDELLENGEVIPGGSEIELELSSIFPSTGLALAAGKVEFRAVFSLQYSNGTWNNWTTEWSDLTHSTNSISSIILPFESGTVSLGIEARSALDLDIITSSEKLEFTIDSDTPLIVDSIPTLGDYVNSEDDRNISLIIADVGGFEHEDLELWAWIRGDNDSNSDGVSEMNEYFSLNFTLEEFSGLWHVNSTINESSNEDHDEVRLLLFGDDLAGNSIPTKSPELGMVWWTTRDAQTSKVDAIEALTAETSRGQLMEIGEVIGWNLQMSDANNISDLYEIKILLGGDDKLGAKYTVADNRCVALDERIQSSSIQCSSTVNSNSRTLEVWIAADWHFNLDGIDQGRLSIEMIDIDGISTEVFNSKWYLKSELDVEFGNFSDITGDVQGELVEGMIVSAGDIITLGIDTVHSESRKPFIGPLSVQWKGTHGELNWQGSYDTDVAAGWIDVEIMVPNTQGLLNADLILMDPYQQVELVRIKIPEIMIDADAPILLDSALDWKLSRYHLNDVQIGLNIDEETSWTGELNLTCMVLSTDVEWGPVSVSQTPVRVSGGLTQFTYYLDLTSLGNPNSLPALASLDCWASGRDDAGHMLTSSKGNNQLEPWLSIKLSNEGPNLLLNEVDAEDKGQEIKLKIIVENNGESLKNPVNLSVWINASGTRERAANQVLSANGIAIQIVRMSIEKPASDFTLEVIIDDENNIWELNEEDNVWSKYYSIDQSEGMGAVIYAGGGIVILIITVLVVLRLKKTSEEDLESPIEETKVVKGPPPPNMARRPPPSLSAQKEVVELDIGAAQDALEALTPTIESVADWSGLPAGGDYIYSADGTYYQGETCGRWKRQEDGSFVKQN